MEASPLSLDLLEILVRSDPGTVARCGATCKLLRRNVTDPAFLRRFRLASADHFFLGLLYHHFLHPPLFALPKSFAGSLPNSVVARVSAELAAGSYKPVASRGGLLILRRRQYPFTLCVCNPVAGRRCVHPLSKQIISDHQLFAVMPEDEGNGGGVDLPFKLLVADGRLRTQTYSSEAGVWGPVTDTPAYLPGHYDQVQPSQVVLGGVADWLYRQRLTRLYHVLALDIGTGQAAWIEVPQDCHRRRKDTAGEPPQELLLVSSADGKVGLLVWEGPLAVTMWTMAADAGSEAGRCWARRVVIDRATILRSVNPVSDPLVCQEIDFHWFAEGSRTVVFQMNCVGVVVLNLRTLEVRHLKRSHFEFAPFCLYELDFASLLRSK